MPLSVAIVGRPNVGKSTLFNRLVGKRIAIVDDTPGVTRDRREGEARLGDLRFRVFDTAGLDLATGDDLSARMQAQTARAVAEADVILLLIDARAGITPLDAHFAEIVRRGTAPVILIANKCEGRAGEGGRLEAYALGLGEPLALSAEHGEGLGDLYDALAPFVDAAASRDEGAATADEEEGGPIRLAIVGRPNVGKSTLVNRLLGEERMITGPEPGITRDAISLPWTHGGHAFCLIDTAGLRRKAKITDKIEELSTADTVRTIRFAHVVVLVLDAAQPMEKQDLTIARLIFDEGRAAVLCCNKWDLVADPGAASRLLADRLEASLHQARGIPVVMLSALTGKGVGRLLPEVLRIYEVWNRRTGTAALNRWLADVTARTPPPPVDGRPIKLRYMTQITARPPTFVLFASRADDLPDAYRRYLVGRLREDLGLMGVPVRLHVRQGRNPYAGER